MIPDPFRRSGQYETAELRSREGHDEQRRDTRQYLREGACPRPGQRQNDGRHERDHHVAHEAVCSHRRDIGPEHPGDHHRGHRHGRQHTDHRPLCHDGIQRQQQEIDRHAHHDLKQQQPEMQHRRLHLPGLDAAECDEEHQEDQRGCNHLVRPPLEGGHGAAKQRPDHHGRRHGDGLDIAVQVFQYVHYFMVSIVRTTCCPEAVPIPHTVPSSGSGSSRNRQTSPSQGCPSSERMRSPGAMTSASASSHTCPTTSCPAERASVKLQAGCGGAFASPPRGMNRKRLRRKSSTTCPQSNNLQPRIRLWPKVRLTGMSAMAVP